MKEKLLGAAYLIAITMIGSFIIACGIGIVVDRINPPVAVISASTPVYVDTPIPTIAPVATSTITYQVESMDKNNFRVTTTNGDILLFNNYDEWDTQVIRCVYTVTVVGHSGNMYRVKHPRIEVAYIPPDNGYGHGRYVAS